MNDAPLFTSSSSLLDLLTYMRSTPSQSRHRPATGATRVRLLSNYSTQYLSMALTASLAHRGLLVEVDDSPYDQWEFVLNSIAQQNPVDYTVLSLSTAKLIVTPHATDVDTFAQYLSERIREYSDHVGGQLIVTVPESLAAESDQSLVFHTWVRDLQHAFRTHLAKSCILFEMDGLVREFGFKRWSAPSHYIRSKLPCHPDCFPAIGSAIGDVISSLQLRPTRLVIVDLDNTLWNGEVGEVGWQGVGLDVAESGYPHVLMQRMFLDLRRNGVLLAIASKNDRESALNVFRNRPEMLLGEDDFAAIEINWQPKSASVQKILTDLNLTARGVAFVDDSRLERNEIRSFFPEVYVPELPEDPVEWPFHLSASRMFSLGLIREEDMTRADMYKLEGERKKLKDASTSYESFLHDLKLVVSAEELSPNNLARAHELVQKTNQFNLTGIRSTESELREIMTSKDHLSFTYSLSDRYGGYGIVSLVILERDSSEWLIHTWVMSCRAMGREVENTVFRHFVQELPGDNWVLRGRYVPTSKNSVVEELLPKLGFIESTPPSTFQLTTTDLKNLQSPLSPRMERRLSDYGQEW